MSIKYAYVDPGTGQHKIVETQEDLLQALAAIAVDTYINFYCGGQAYTIVEVQGDGSEKWYTPSGEPTLTPAEIAAAAKIVLQGKNVGQITVTTL